MSKVAESSAIEELAVAIGKDIGQLTKLGTVDKSSLVDAINEVLAGRPSTMSISTTYTDEDISNILSRLDVIEKKLNITQ